MAEATRTATGLPNVPDVSTIKRMQYLAQTVIEPLRAYIGAPIKVHSFYRSPAVNRKVGGVSTSQHVYGEAIDFSCPGVPDQILFDYIRLNLPFDQLILEPSWVHVSLKDGTNRAQVLIAKRNAAGKMFYTPFE